MRYVRDEMVKTYVANNLISGMEESIPVPFSFILM
jgi:hypothetical protein